MFKYDSMTSVDLDLGLILRKWEKRNLRLFLISIVPVSENCTYKEKELN
jgi:hypothetical protein